MSLDSAIDGFFAQLRDFAKRVDDDVANLRRSLDHGYSLGPQQFRERLKTLQRQCVDVEHALMDLESRTVDATTLTELSNHCLLVYQNVANGINVLEAHLKNYGYEHGQNEIAPFDPMELMRQILKSEDRCITPMPLEVTLDLLGDLECVCVCSRLKLKQGHR